MFLSTPCVYISQLPLSLSPRQRAQTDRQSSENALPVHHLSTLLKKSKVLGEGEEGRKNAKGENTRRRRRRRKKRSEFSKHLSHSCIRCSRTSFTFYCSGEAGRQAPHTR
jgi:hypothetical protein